MTFLMRLYKSNWLLGKNGPMKISLLQCYCYIVLWIHNDDVICILQPGQNDFEALVSSFLRDHLPNAEKIVLVPLGYLHFSPDLSLIYFTVSKNL